jgi:hypothetical protein
LFCNLIEAPNVNDAFPRCTACGSRIAIPNLTQRQVYAPASNLFATDASQFDFQSTAANNNNGSLSSFALNNAGQQYSSL